jgi:hypothetical protein
MTALVVILMLLTAWWVGYHIGSSMKPTRKKRTRRVAFGRHVIALVALLMVGRIERSVRRKLPDSRVWRHRRGKSLECYLKGLRPSASRPSSLALPLDKSPRWKLDRGRIPRRIAERTESILVHPVTSRPLLALLRPRLPPRRRQLVTVRRHPLGSAPHLLVEQLGRRDQTRSSTGEHRRTPAGRTHKRTGLLYG